MEKIELVVRIKSKFKPGVPHVAKGKHGKLYECKEEHTYSDEGGASVFCAGDKWVSLEQHLYFVHDINLRSGDLPQWMSNPKPATQNSVEHTSEFGTVQQNDEIREAGDEYICNWLLSGGLNVSQIETRSFVRMMHDLHPNYTIPSKEIVNTEILPRQYRKAIKLLKEVHQLTIT